MALSPHRNLGRRAFTLIELLVTVAIIATLVGVLVPTLSGARGRAQTLQCQLNIRNLQHANLAYAYDHESAMIDVGLSHGGVHGDEKLTWVRTLERYYDQKLVVRSPVDTSPHWPDEGVPAAIEPVTGDDVYRRTSYGVNGYLANSVSATDLAINNTGPSRSDTEVANRLKIDNLKRPWATVHFLVMAYEGPFSASDHTHPEGWYSRFLPGLTPFLAANEVQINAHGGPVRLTNDAGVNIPFDQAMASTSNYGFVDGSARTLRFDEVYKTGFANLFHPEIAHLNSQ